MTCLTSQMALTPTTRENIIRNIPVRGTVYRVLSARNVETSGGGTRLLVEFQSTANDIPHSLFCLYHPRNTFLTDQEVIEVNNRTRTLHATYIGLNIRGDHVYLKSWQ